MVCSATIVKYLLLSSIISVTSLKQCYRGFRITNCRNGVYYVNISKLYQNKIQTQYESNCSKTSYSIEWNIRNPNNKIILSKQGTSFYFVIEPYLLPTGRSFVKAILKEYLHGHRIEISIAECFLDVQLEYPISLISGGSERQVKSNNTYVLDASGSIDLESGPGQPPNLNYKWSCWNCPIQLYANIQKAKSSIIKVEKEFALVDTNYQFTVIINTPGKENYVKSNQSVHVLTNDTINTSIECEKNCPPAAFITDPELSTMLLAKIDHNYNKISYLWTVLSHSTFDYQNSTKHGRNNQRLFIKSNILQHGSRYIFEVKIKDGEQHTNGSAKVEIIIPSLTKFEGCEIIPPEGIAMETKFVVSNCKYDKANLKSTNNFFLYARSEIGTTLLLASAIFPEELEFYLPTNKKIFLEVVDKNFFKTIIHLDVKVNPSVLYRSKNIQESFNNKATVLKFLISKGDMEKVIQVIANLVNAVEIHRKFLSDSAEDIQRILLDYVRQIEIENCRSAETIVNVINDINNMAKNANPSVGDEATQICTEISVNVKILLKKRIFDNCFNNFNDLIGIILKCGEKYLVPNYPTVTNNNATILSVLQGNVTEEHSYDINIQDALESYYNITSNIIQMCENTRSAMLELLKPDEGILTGKSKNCNAFAIKVTGKDMAAKKFIYKTVQIGRTEHFRHAVAPIEISGCIWTNDIFWWHKKSMQGVTDIALLTITNKQINILASPLKISFKVIKQINITDRVIEYGGENDSSGIFLIRIDVSKNQNFVIEFDGPDKNMKISITYFRKPTNLDVVIPVQKQRPINFVKLNDGWWYLGMLKKAIIQKVTLRIFTVGCSKWNNNKNDWEVACRGMPGKFDRKYIKCLCSHFSIMSGYVRDNNFKVEDQPISYEWVMKLEASYVILVTTATLLFIYFCCILILITANRLKLTKYIYYLADIPQSATYLYIIVVRTGCKISAGTTSNICIQLFGTVKTSKAYVLNYPDPELRFLQRNSENWFFLATRDNLGDVTEIKIWSDFTGMKPKWYCNDITIFDIKENKSWQFPIYKWFTVDNDNNICFKVKHDSQLVKRLKFIDICNGFILENADYAKLSIYFKWTIYLSIILNIYVLNLILFGLPKLNLTDSFVVHGNNCENTHYLWFYPVITAIITFIVHWALIYCLIREKQDLRIEQNCNRMNKCSRRSVLLKLIIYLHCVFCLTILIIFGFWVPEVTAWCWMISSHVGIAEYFIVLHNIYAFFRKTEQKPIIIAASLEEILPVSEAQKIYLYDHFTKYSLRPYLSHLYKEPKEDILELKRQKYSSKFSWTELIDDLMMILFYIIFLLLIILYDSSDLKHYSRTNVMDAVNGKYTRTLSLQHIRSIDDIYEYLNKTLIPVTQPQFWYGKNIPENRKLENFFGEILGTVRLRQHRVTANSCKLPERMHHITKFVSCEGEYFSQPYFGNIKYYINPLDRFKSIWRYTSVPEAQSGSFQGRFAKYPSGGYEGGLGHTLRNSLLNLQYLKERGWINQYMRAILIEFFVYNCNSNLFNRVTIAVEKSATSHYSARVAVDTKYVLVLEEQDILLAHFTHFLAFVTLLFFSFTLLRKVIARIMKHEYFWSCIDLTIIVLTYIVVYLAIRRVLDIYLLLEDLVTFPQDIFLKYFFTYSVEDFAILCAGILIVLTVFRLWYLMHLAKALRLLEISLCYSIKVVIHIMLLHSVIICAFAFVSTIIFGSQSLKFYYLGKSFIHIITEGLHFGDFDFKLCAEHNQGIAFVTFPVVCFVTLIMGKLYVAVVIYNYQLAQKIYSNVERDLFFDYLTAQFTYFKHFFKVRLFGGASADNDEHVTPKKDRKRYEGCIKIKRNKMKIMALIVIYRLKSHLTNKWRAQIMLYILQLRRIEFPKPDLFYKVHDLENIKLIHDNRFVRMEMFVKILLSTKLQKDVVTNREKKHKLLGQKQLKQLDYTLETLKAYTKLMNLIKFEADEKEK